MIAAMEYSASTTPPYAQEGRDKSAVVGALALYLDFINLFLFFLRIFGGSR